MLQYGNWIFRRLEPTARGYYAKYKRLRDIDKNDPWRNGQVFRPPVFFRSGNPTLAGVVKCCQCEKTPKPAFAMRGDHHRLRHRICLSLSQHEPPLLILRDESPPCGQAGAGAFVVSDITIVLETGGHVWGGRRVLIVAGQAR